MHTRLLNENTPHALHGSSFGAVEEPLEMSAPPGYLLPCVPVGAVKNAQSQHAFFLHVKCVLKMRRSKGVRCTRYTLIPAAFTAGLEFAQLLKLRLYYFSSLVKRELLQFWSV